MKMSGNFLWDTNIAIAFYDQDPRILKRVADAKIYVPSIVIGELWFGAEKSKKKDRKSTRLNSSHPSRSRMPSSAWKKKNKRKRKSF